MKREKTALVLGGGGFIGHHLVRRLKGEGCWVRSVDLKYPEHNKSVADEFVVGDLREKAVCEKALRLSMGRLFDEVYQLAADMGGAGYIFAGCHDATIMYNSASVNLNVAAAAAQQGVGKLFFASSACIYPSQNQLDPEKPNCAEDTAYPAAPDSEYGWEKLFGERLFLAFSRNARLNLRIGRLHNIFGPGCAWTGGREKAPAALCRKVAEAADNGEIEIWGDGMQTRSFLFIDECLEGVRRLMDSDFSQPLNIGSEEMISINKLAEMIIGISGKKLSLRHTQGPLGVRGRNSDNTLSQKTLGWAPTDPLIRGIEETYHWIASQL